MRKFLCIDVGGTAIKYAVINEKLELSEQGKVTTPYDGVEVYLQCLTDVYKKFENEVSGIAISVPGRISPDGVCTSAGALAYATGLPLVDELSKRCCVPVTAMNDAKSAALAEAKWGILSDCKDGIVVTLGTGIGGGIIKDGQVHYGANYAAGELSCISLGENIGGLEDFWGGVGVPTLIKWTAKAKQDSNITNGEDVFKLVNTGDEVACQVLDRFTKVIARMILNLQMIFDPEKIAFGGGISRQPILIEYIKKNVGEYCNKFYSVMGMPKPTVTTCKFFNDANLIGAYANFVNHYAKNC